MRAVQNFSIFLGPGDSSDENPNFEEMAKTSDKSADEIYINFVHEVISSFAYETFFFPFTESTG